MDDRILNLRHELHAHPELSGQEEWTKRRLMQFLQQNTSLEIVDRGNWFYAVKKPQCRNAESSDKDASVAGKTYTGTIDTSKISNSTALNRKQAGIAFRADYDGLPIGECLPLPYVSQREGVSHKCGHDGHAAVLCAVALALDGLEEGLLDRAVYLIFQPAEETGQGGAVCAELLKEKTISEVYAFHNRSAYPEGAVVLKNGLIQCASKGLMIRFRGKTSHASEPENGCNPAGEIAELAGLAERIKEKNEAGQYQGLVMCTVIDISMGEQNFGVSPGEGEISFTLRADHEAELEYIEEKIRCRALELAARKSMEVFFREYDPFPETCNDEYCTERVREVAGRLHLPVIEMDKPWRASEDFGYYTKLCPGAIFYIGNGMDYPALHTPEYDFNDRILDEAAAMFLVLAGVSEGQEE